jgi:NTE family protein
MSTIPKVAIACQGGGSHAAFAAGVLVELLSAAQRERFQLVALSGTSGGAMCAALAWRGLIAGGPEDAGRRLLRFWRDLEVHDLVEAFANFWNVWLARLPITAEVSPYLYEPMTEPRLRSILRRHLDLEEFTTDPARRARPKLIVGATDVLNGERVIFHGESLTYDDLVASAALPPLFRAVCADHRLYWDGLFATNPPIREFTDLEERPDEIWVVQINPQRRDAEPRGMQEIKDRINELAGNLSLGQELYFIDRINRLLQSYPSLSDKYKPIKIRIVELELESERLNYSSKLDRGISHIERLLDAGQKRAPSFFDERSNWPRAKTVPPKSVVVSRGHGSERR